MTPKEVTKIARMDEFNRLADMLNITDRQKQVFDYKYHRMWRVADIAAKLDFHIDTINEDLRIIREKMKAISPEELEAKAKGQKEQ